MKSNKQEQLLYELSINFNTTQKIIQDYLYTLWNSLRYNEFKPIINNFQSKYFISLNTPNEVIIECIIKEINYIQDETGIYITIKDLTVDKAMELLKK